MLKDTRQPWFKEAKYGLFIHWGLYSVLAGEWNGKKTPNIGEWIMNHLNIPVAEYEKVAEQFNPVHFNAEEYVKKAKDWGMRYIVFTAKHHDGFTMYHSKCNPYNVVDATPFGRDVVKELQLACEKYGMKLGLYYSQAQDWHDPDGYMTDKDNSGKNFRAYLDRTCKPQLKELLTEYGDLAIIWFDTPLNMTEEESRELFDYVKSFQPDCIVSGRIGNNLGEYMTTGDNFIPLLPYPGDWEVPATLNETWGYKADDHRWRSADTIIDLLQRINGRGGNYLLNVGPDALGDIPPASVRILDEVGDYLRRNGDSIYGTKCLPFYPYELDWCHFTCKDYKLFLHLTDNNARLLISNISNTIKRAYILDSGAEVAHFSRPTSEGYGTWEFYLPETVKSKKHVTICVEMEEKDLCFQPIADWEQ